MYSVQNITNIIYSILDNSSLTTQKTGGELPKIFLEEPEIYKAAKRLSKRKNYTYEDVTKEAIKARDEIFTQDLEL